MKLPTFESDLAEAIRIYDEERDCSNAYLYFELACTRQTGWMCWLIDKEGGARHVFAQGQGSAHEALAPVLAVLQKMESGKMSSRSMAFQAL